MNTTCDVDTITTVIRITAYAVTIPGLVAWAMIVYRRKMYEVSALMLILSVFMVCLLSSAYLRVNDLQSDVIHVLATLSLIAVTIVVFYSLWHELRHNVTIEYGKSGEDAGDNGDDGQRAAV